MDKGDDRTSFYNVKQSVNNNPFSQLYIHSHHNGHIVIILKYTALNGHIVKLKYYEILSLFQHLKSEINYTHFNIVINIDKFYLHVGPGPRLYLIILQRNTNTKKEIYITISRYYTFCNKLLKSILYGGWCWLESLWGSSLLIPLSVFHKLHHCTVSPFHF